MNAVNNDATLSPVIDSAELSRIETRLAAFWEDHIREHVQLRLAAGGPQDGATLWYIVTDTSDEANAAALGLNFSSKLLFSELPDEMAATFMSNSVREGYYDVNGVLVVSGGPVDFTPVRAVTPGSTDTQGTSNLLASLTFQPGAASMLEQYGAS